MLAEGPVGGSVFADHRPQVRVTVRVYRLGYSKVRIRGHIHSDLWSAVSGHFSWNSDTL